VGTCAGGWVGVQSVSIKDRMYVNLGKRVRGIPERVVEFLNPILDAAGLPMACVVQNALTQGCRLSSSLLVGRGGSLHVGIEWGEMN
jgi:hypothetical protein